MALFNLIARLGLNTSGFEVGLKRAESTATRFADKVGSDVRRKFIQAFGVGAIIAGTARMHREVLQHVREIDQLALKYKKSTTEVQQMMAVSRALGITFEQLNERLETTGESLDKLKGFQDKPPLSERDLALLRQYDREMQNISTHAKSGFGQFLADVREAFGIFTRPFTRPDTSGAVLLGPPRPPPKTDTKDLDQKIAALQFQALPDASKLDALINKLASIDQAQLDDLILGDESAFKRNEIEALQALQEIRQLETKLRGSPKIERGELTARQQAGAFSGVSPVILEQRNNTRTLEQARQLLAKIEANTRGKALAGANPWD